MKAKLHDARFTLKGNFTLSIKEWIQQHMFRTAGIASIGAALLAVVGDELSQYSSRGYASIADVERTLPFWRLLTGEMLGVLGIPLCLIGYWCVCQALYWSGVKSTRGMFWLSAYGLLLMGVVSHVIILSAYMTTQAGNAPAITSVTNRLLSAAYFPGSLFLISYLIVSVWYFVAVIAGHTLYPRWMAFVCPCLLSLLIALLHTANILSIVLNVLSPAWLSIPHLIFFTLSALALWNKEKAL